MSSKSPKGNQDSKLPKVAITMGDPAGVGPEICLKAMQNRELKTVCQPILFGDLEVFKAVSTKLGIPLDLPVVHRSTDSELDSIDGPCIYDFDSIALRDFEPGRINQATGKSSYLYFETAIRLAQKSLIQAIATGPISKDALQQAGYRYPGHTEILADLTDTRDFCMLLTSQIISCSFVTTHVGLHQVADLINQERVLSTIHLTAMAMRKLRGREVRLVCCGLNPHAGEEGLMGRREEEHAILPAIQAARHQGIEVTGPVPADTAFLPSQREKTDAYICMYHDQGGIPVKSLAFDEAVNVTLGSPVIRTSVDHGTAADIAWQGVANPRSLCEAIKLGARLCQSHPEVN